MNFEEYQAAAIRTARSMRSQTLDLTHAQIGLCTEVGEFATEVKRLFAYDKPLTDEALDHMAEELGDILWYVALAAQALGTPMQAIAAHNILKLSKRYPEKFTPQLAEARLDKGGAGPRES